MSDHAKSSPLGRPISVYGARLLSERISPMQSHAGPRALNAPVALIIATTKALLVALFFMHLKVRAKNS